MGGGGSQRTSTKIPKELKPLFGAISQYALPAIGAETFQPTPMDVGEEAILNLARSRAASGAPLGGEASRDYLRRQLAGEFLNRENPALKEFQRRFSQSYYRDVVDPGLERLGQQFALKGQGYSGLKAQEAGRFLNQAQQNLLQQFAGQDYSLLEAERARQAATSAQLAQLEQGDIGALQALLGITERPRLIAERAKELPLQTILSALQGTPVIAQSPTAGINPAALAISGVGAAAQGVGAGLDLYRAFR